MIRSVPELRSLSTDVIKIAQNTDPTKTEGKRLLGLITDILDTVDDLVAKQGLSISSDMQQQRVDILNQINGNLTSLNSSLQSYITSHMPDLSGYALSSQLPNLSIYQKSTDVIPYARLSGTPTIPTLPDLTSYAKKTDIPTIPTYDFSVYQKTSDNIPFSRLTGVPNSFDGTWTSLTGKPTFFDGDYTKLTNKPNIPTYDLSLYRLKSETVDYTQLANKPNMSKLLWNQIVPISVTNTTSEVNSLVTGNGTLNIEANPVVGTSFRLTGRGLFSLQTLTSPALTVKLYLGTTLIASGTSNSLLLGASNKSFSFGTDILITATNQVYAQGFFAYYAGATDALSSTPLVNSSGGALNTTVDLSVSNQLKMTFTWSIASAANIIMVKVANIEKLNN